MKRSIGKEYAAIKVKRIKPNVYQIVPDSICLLPSCTTVTEMEKRKIVDEEGNEMTPDGRFLWTTETIDPYHLVIDI